MKNSFIYSLRINIVPSLNEETNMLATLDFCKKAQIDDVAFFIFAEEYNIGHYTIKDVEPYVTMIKKYRSLFDEQGITISLNPWYTLSHADRFTKEVKCRYNTMVDASGYKSIMVACPFDKKWLSDFIELYKYLIKELSPNIIWMEDDFRLHNHEPMDFGGCFCSEHMRAYNEYLGAELSREEFLEGMKSKNGAKFRRAYAKVNGDLFNYVTKRIGEELPRQSHIGLMTSDPRVYMIEGRNQKTVFENLGAQTESVNRVNLSSYRQRPPQEYMFDFSCANMLEGFMTPKKTYILPEIENFPHSLMSKSANFLGYQILAATALGCEGITLSIFDFCGNGVNLDWNYQKKLAEIKPFLNKVKGMNIREYDMDGVAVMINYSSPQAKKQQLNSLYDMRAYDSYFAGYLQLAGIATHFCDDMSVENKIIAVSDCFLEGLESDAIIMLFKKNNVILDGKSASILIERGLGYLINATRATQLQERTGQYSYEKATAESVNDKRASSLFFCGTLYKIDYSGDYKVVTGQYNPYGEFFCNGITKVNGHLVIPFYNTEYPVSVYAELRVKSIKEFIANSGKPYFMLNKSGVSPYYFVKKDKKIALVINCLDDEQSGVELLTDSKIKVENCYTSAGLQNQKTISIIPEKGVCLLELSD